MPHQKGFFTGSAGYRLSYQAWLPEDTPRAVVFIAHGIVEHVGRYSGLGEYLSAQGLAVYAFDYRHHGLSDGVKGRIDDFGLINRDFGLFLEKIREWQPGRPVFLLGHSMGASLSLAFAASLDTELAGLVLSGTPLRSRPVLPTPVIGLLYPLAKIVPDLGLYRLDSATLSRDKKVVAGYDTDPLVFRGKLSCRLILSFLWGLHKVESNLDKIDVPVLLMHGSRDNLCAPEGSRVVNRKIGSKDKTLLLYPDFYHEILNEPEKVRVREDILKWIDQRIR